MAHQYQLFCQSVIGERHIKEGTPKEDYGLVEQGDGYKVFVLGDGHGDPNCMRSRIGSEYVCEVAAEKLGRFVSTVRELEMESVILDEEKREPIIRQLITSIVGTWGRMVNEELEANPITEEEEKQADRYRDYYKAGQRLEHIYGTTLIAGVLTDTYLLLLQQGDGRCDVFDANGCVSQPIPWDDRCVANVCTSMCESDAVESCRYHIIDIRENPVIACVAGSDGVEDSFNNMERVHSFFRQKLMYACENGVEALVEHLGETLPEFNANGSQDDTTVCGFIDIERCSAFVEFFKEENEKVELQSEVNWLDERLTSMQTKLIYLKNKYEDAVSSYEEKNSQLLKLKSDVEEARVAKENLEAQYFPYRQTHEDLLTRKEELLKKISGNQQGQ